MEIYIQTIGETIKIMIEKKIQGNKQFKQNNVVVIRIETDMVMYNKVAITELIKVMK